MCGPTFLMSHSEAWLERRLRSVMAGFKWFSNTMRPLGGNRYELRSQLRVHFLADNHRTILVHIWNVGNVTCINIWNVGNVTCEKTIRAEYSNNSMQGDSIPSNVCFFFLFLFYSIKNVYLCKIKLLFI